MKFLEKLTDIILSKDENLLVILPSKRSILYLKEQFKRRKIDTILPDIKTMDDFVVELSGLKVEDNLEIFGICYEVYKNFVKNNENFNRFIDVFDIFLNDFNDLDLYLIDEKRIKDIEILKDYGDFGPLGKNYLKFMELFYKIYVGLNKELEKRNSGYRGRIYRRASERSKDFKSYKDIIIAGFGIFTPSEQKIIDNLIKNCSTLIIFDVKEELLEKDFESVKFIKEYIRKWGENTKIIDVSKNESINISPYPLPVSQVQVLEEVFKDNESSGTVVLPDETLLFPVISGIPKDIKKINITMGFPFEQTTIAKFLIDILKMHADKSEKGFYHKSLLDVINSTYVKNFSKDKKFVEILKEKIEEGYTYLNFENEFKDELFDNIFNWYENGKLLLAKEIVGKLLNILLMVSKKEDENSVIEEANSIKMVKLLNRIMTFLENYKDIKIESIGEIENLIRRIIVKERVPYSGDPLQDFQVMGLLETRCLDFEKTVILSVNEGILPKGKVEKSFIPYDIRTNWGLPTYRENEILFSYYFYSLLFKSKNFYITYSTDGDNDFKERSRFVEQIVYEKRKDGLFKNTNVNFVFKDFFVGNRVSLRKIEKNEKIIEILKGKSFSPTAIIKYLYDPIDFFYNFVLGIRDENEPGEVGTDVIGTSAHKILEKVYSDFKSEKLLDKDPEKILKEIECEKLIQEIFKNNRIPDSSTGKPLLMREMIKKIVKDFLVYDLKRIKNGVEIKSVEKTYETEIEIDGDKIKLKGTIDRIESENGITRICDYKSGRISDSEMKLKNFDFLNDESSKNFDNLKIDPVKISKPFQLLFYGYLLNKKENFEDFGLRIYSLRYPKKIFDLKNEDGMLLLFGNDQKKNFESLLFLILKDIFDKSKNFIKIKDRFEF